MAKANWVKTDKTYGSGNATVNVSSAADHTGRNVRTTILTWKGANVEDAPATVAQAGKPEFVDIDDAASSESTGKVVTISGVSNSARLAFSLGTGNLDIVLPSTYIANSLTVASDYCVRRCRTSGRLSADTSWRRTIYHYHANIDRA